MNKLLKRGKLYFIHIPFILRLLEKYPQLWRTAVVRGTQGRPSAWGRGLSGTRGRGVGRRDSFHNYFTITACAGLAADGMSGGACGGDGRGGCRVRAVRPREDGAL